MLTVLIVIYGSLMWVQELCRDLYDDSLWLEVVANCYKNSIIDIGSVSGSTAGREWNTILG